MDDEPGPLELLTEALYPKPSPPGALLSDAVAAVAGFEAGTVPIADQVGNLRRDAATLDGSIGGLGGQIDQPAQALNALRPGAAVEGIEGILTSPSPLSVMSETLPKGPGTLPPPPNSSVFQSDVEGSMANLKAQIEGFIIQTELNPIG